MTEIYGALSEMPEEIYFLDTYALVEIVYGNENYLRFKKAKCLVTIFNLMELHYRLLQDHGDEQAREKTVQFSKWLFRFEILDIFEANLFRRANLAKKLSFTDCLGYIISKNKKIRFVTGDKQFENMDNVEFVR